VGEALALAAERPEDYARVVVKFAEAARALTAASLFALHAAVLASLSSRLLTPPLAATSHRAVTSRSRTS
jgi:hypothetical protein